MSFDYVRKMVSGSKARFVDTETAVDLDLVYGMSDPPAQLVDLGSCPLLSDRQDHHVSLPVLGLVEL